MTIYPEKPHTMHGVSGTMRERHLFDRTGLFKSQRWVSEYRFFGAPKRGQKHTHRIQVTIRFSEIGQNDFMDFSVTCTIDRRSPTVDTVWNSEGAGCNHEMIAEHFPQLAHLIKWHSHTTNGPINGASNAAYAASNRDHDGLLKGERRQILLGGDPARPCWTRAAMRNGEMLDLHEIRRESAYGTTKPVDEHPITVEWVPLCHVGKGKERDFSRARSFFPTMDISDVNLMLERAELEKRLTALIPQTIADFRADVERAGFMWCQN